MRRRAFIAALGGLAALPFAALAQSDRRRLIGMLLSQAEGDQEAKHRIAALREGLQKLGWTEGRNIRIELRYAGGSADRMRAYAEDLAKLNPDILFASATSSLLALSRMTTTIPIVFAQVTDPVGAGFVSSLAQPGGNITGFTQHEFSIGSKWMELLKQLAPQTERVALIYDPQNPAIEGYRTVMRASVRLFGVQISEYPVSNAAEIERAMSLIAAQPASGFIVLPGPVPTAHRDLVVSLAHRHRLPAVYAFRFWPAAGGLASYGIDNIGLYRLAADYVDRILKGERPGDLPIQHATKFELVINLKTARALGLDPPNSLLARADEVIE
ncbi:MAG: ABC transporter substrate-binding protein [Xanthobacteraceae bacterium]|nr:ABC transporter substrate-binding protein [Xanthobacteraceae bacterium]